MERYARDDARFTFDLYKKFRPKLEAEPLRWELYLTEMEVCRVLIRAEAKGTRLDPKQVNKLKKKWDTLEVELRESLEQQLGDALTHADFAGSYDEDTDATTGAALRDALLAVGVPLYRTTPKGFLATNRFALQEFIEDHPVVRTLFDWRRAYRFQGTYLTPLVGRETVHPSFMQAEAWTGRMSCRRPNMQNLPKRGEDEERAADAKEMRSVFVAREGCAFAVTDYEGIEAKLLAYYLGAAGAPYREMIRDGLDTHAWMASVIWGGAIADYEKGTSGRPKRDEAKNVLFAITYGAGKPRVADMLKVSKSEAGQIIDTIKSSIPGFKKLQYRIRKKIESVGHVNTYFGRKQVVSPDKSYVGLNALIQGTAADILKRGMVEVQRLFDEADIGWQILLLVHDETVSEGPEEHAELALKLQEQGMLSALPDLDPPLLVESSIVRSYGDG
jgi:DNA polymerase-1